VEVAVGAAVLVRQFRRRLTISAVGLLTVDWFFSRRAVDLLHLVALDLRPPSRDPRDHPRVGPVTASRRPQLVLRDAEGREVGMPLSEYWGPRGPLFARLLAGARRSGVRLDGPAGIELRYLAGETDPQDSPRRAG